MRTPQPPPAFELDQASIEFLGQHPDFVRQANHRYFSWDDIRRRAVPGKWSSHDAWAALETARRLHARPLPLLDKRGEPFRVVLTDQIHEWVLRAEGLAADPLGLIPKAQGDERRHLLASLREEAIHSSLLEGAATTRAAAKAMLREGRAPRGHGERMIVNNYRTIEMLKDLANQDLTPELIYEIHRSMTEGTLDDPNDEGRPQAPGEDRVHVADLDGDVVHVPPSASELPDRVKRLCDFANATEPFLPPLVRASLVHFQLAYDHPFVDGNGRTARALFYWQLIRTRHRLARYLSISRVIFGSKRRYERAYIHAEQTRDATYFVQYHVDVYVRAIDELGTYLQRKRDEARRTERALRSWDALNHRQKAVLDKALQDPSRSWTGRSHGGEHGVTLPTALSDLKGLVAAGLFEQRKRGRGFLFVPAERLDDRIRRGPDHDPRQGSLLEL